MLKYLKVEKLNGRISDEIEFNTKLNILTGRNGSGKTTIIKLLWYMISGNLERIPREMSFRSVELTTDRFELRIAHRPSTGVSTSAPSDAPTYQWTFRLKDSYDITAEGNGDDHEVQLMNHIIAEGPSGSLFFPTFRRVEGGFSIPRSGREARHSRAHASEDADRIAVALGRLCTSISVGNHRFVAAISTHDIVELLTAEYAGVSERINAGHTVLSRQIIALIQKQKIESSNHEQLADILTTISDQVHKNSDEQEEALKKFNMLNKLIKDLFQYHGISITPQFSLGEARNAISSELLSAGEKQMLSFIAYNAFSHKRVIFIDEPEISLHVDWQRSLFSVLLEQGGSNQFVVATHSPFIYSRYPECEKLLGEKGGE